MTEFFFLCVTHWLVLGLGIFVGVFFAGALTNAPVLQDKEPLRYREIDLSRSEYRRV